MRSEPMTSVADRDRPGNTRAGLCDIRQGDPRDKLATHHRSLVFNPRRCEGATDCGPADSAAEGKEDIRCSRNPIIYR
jgi:hypothetical protein